jgi:hypothetical protein
MHVAVDMHESFQLLQGLLERVEIERLFHDVEDREMHGLGKRRCFRAFAFVGAADDKDGNPATDIPQVAEYVRSAVRPYRQIEGNAIEGIGVERRYGAFVAVRLGNEEPQGRGEPPDDHPMHIVVLDNQQPDLLPPSRFDRRRGQCRSGHNVGPLLAAAID